MAGENGETFSFGLWIGTAWYWIAYDLIRIGSGGRLVEGVTWASFLTSASILYPYTVCWLVKFQPLWIRFNGNKEKIKSF